MSFSTAVYKLLQDSLETKSPEQIYSGSDYKDTSTIVPHGEGLKVDTTATVIEKYDSLRTSPRKFSNTTITRAIREEPESQNITSIDTNLTGIIKVAEKYDRYHLFKSSNNSFTYKPFDVFITQRDSNGSGITNIQFEQREFQQAKYSWALIVGFFSIFLLLILKTYYHKALTQVMNTIVNFQLSEKILREKNVIIRRAFFILNVNFILMFSLFALLMLNLFDFHVNDNSFISYLLITGGILLILLSRLVILYLTGIIFNSLSIISEYLHSIYLINKNMGLILLPIIFSALYTPADISKIILIIGFVIVCIATFFKYIRGLQIIFKNDILKFYSFLYLCTLELLPIVVSCKIIISLR